MKLLFVLNLISAWALLLIFRRNKMPFRLKVWTACTGVLGLPTLLIVFVVCHHVCHLSSWVLEEEYHG